MANYKIETTIRQPCHKLEDTKKTSETIELSSPNEKAKSMNKDSNTSLKTFTTYNIWV